MKRIWVIGTVLGVLLGAQAAMALCRDPTMCYCSLKPEPGQALARVQVEEVNEEGVDLRILGSVFYDPSGLLDGAVVPQGIGAGDWDLQAGQTWLVSLGRVGDDLVILFGVQESDGLLPCEWDPDFPGASADTVAGAVLCDNCSAAVRDLGVYEECDMGMCADSIGGVPHGPSEVFWGFVFALAGFAWFRRGRG